MIRDIDLKEISDGKLYDLNDMAKLGVDDCSGCHACCCGMGDSITLDPYDVYRLEKGLGKSFEELLASNLELRVADGIILPCLKMAKMNVRPVLFLMKKGAAAFTDSGPESADYFLWAEYLMMLRINIFCRCMNVIRNARPSIR